MTGDALAALHEVLGRAGIRWYLFGAQAALLYGVPRMTADVDATAEFPLDRAEELSQLLVAGGFALRAGDVQGFVRRTRVIPLTHIASGVPLDLVLAGPGLEEEFLDRARPIEVRGVTIPVIAPDDLIVTKVLAGRAKDLEDVRDVLRQQGQDLDMVRIRRILGLLESALDRSDLLASFEAAMRDAGKNA